MKQFRHILSVLMIILIAVLASGTIVERLHGSEVAMAQVYGTWWFVGLWALMAILMVWMAVKYRMWRQPVVLILHLSILLILMGALLTKFTGQQGRMLLRPGKPTHTFYVGNAVENHPVKLPFTLTLDRFEIVPYSGTRTPMDFVSHVTIGDGSEGEKTTISMNHILRHRHYRFYQTDFDQWGDSILSVTRDPWGIGFTYTGYALLFISLVTMLIKRQTPRGLADQKRSTANRVVTLTWLSVLVILLVVLYIRMLTHQLMPVLRSPLFSVHISTIVTAYALLLAIMLVGIMAIIKPKDLAWQERLKAISKAMLYPAVALLATGIFIGAVWANVSWGNYWSWDPKEVWALITLLIYMAPLHESIWKSFHKPLFFNIYVILAFLSVLTTYFGVNLVLGGIHSYN